MWPSEAGSLGWKSRQIQTSDGWITVSDRDAGLFDSEDDLRTSEISEIADSKANENAGRRDSSSPSLRLARSIVPRLGIPAHARLEVVHAAIRLAAFLSGDCEQLS